MKHIYPLVEMTHSHGRIKMSTYLRKKHSENGKWYLCYFFRDMICKEESSKLTFINRFHTDVYLFLICGIIQEKQVDVYDQRIHVKDESQISEEDRLKQILE